MSTHTPTTHQSAPTVGEIGEGLMLAASAIAIGAPTLPGFLLAVPGLLVFILPVVAIWLLAATAALVIAIVTVPVLVVRRIVRRGRRSVAARRAPRPPMMPRRPQLPRPSVAR